MLERHSYFQSLTTLFCFDCNLSFPIMFQPLQVKSVIAVEGLKGYIYIEAYKQTHVKQVSKEN
jgi:transcription elongation factor SPT5